jgi:hypothetical protein
VLRAHLSTRIDLSRALEDSQFNACVRGLPVDHVSAKQAQRSLSRRDLTPR